MCPTATPAIHTYAMDNGYWAHWRCVGGGMRRIEVKTNAKALSLLSSSGDDISSDKINDGKVNSNNWLATKCTARKCNEVC